MIHLADEQSAIKRENVFKPVEDARLARLAAAQVAAAEKPPVTQKEGEEQPAENDAAMEVVEQENPKKTAPGPKAKKRSYKGKAKNKGKVTKKKIKKFF